MSSNSQEGAAGTKRSNAGSEKPPGQQKQPRNPRSAFICYTDAKKKDFALDHGSSKSKSALLKIASEEWRKLAPKERAYWEEQARIDKLRFVREKAQYKGQWATPKKRAKKDPNAPRRPMSAFLKYSKMTRPRVKKENPHLENTDVSRLLGEMWKNADPEERKPYEDNELLERAAYNATIQKWREEVARKGSEAQASHQKIRAENIPQPNTQVFATEFSTPHYSEVEVGPYEPYSMQSVEGVFQKGEERSDLGAGAESVAITPDHSTYRRPRYSTYPPPFITDMSHSNTREHYSRHHHPHTRTYDPRQYETPYPSSQGTHESKYRTPHYGSYHFS